jgi:cytochrome c oxidase accessory protein FixG
MTYELPKERLATTDSTGKRVYLYPATVDGAYRQKKLRVHAFLLLLFLVLPWIHVHGRQLLLLDVARREFFFFGLHFRAHDAPMLVFLFLSFAFLIGLITALWGRLWCGWACPQTVFIEALYRRIETWIEGNHRERKALDEGPWNAEKFRKKALKWAAFAAVSLVATHSFLAYFVGSNEMIGMILRPPAENWTSFLVILFTTGIILLDFGWFREQFCVIMCPYGRFQSVMLDSNSLVVAYDAKRGEPRRGSPGISSTAPQGDCVNCFRCVQVCPTGIDIRRGLQMECIACTACVDACHEVMTKIKKPVGLIRYTTLAELKGFQRMNLRPRTVAYALLLLAAIGGLTFSLSRTDFMEAIVLRAVDTPYQVIPGESGAMVVNHFRLDLSNQTGRTQVLTLQLGQPELDAKFSLAMAMNPITLPDSAKQRVDFFLKFPASALQHGSRKLTLFLSHEAEKREIEVTLVGPGA